MALHWKEGAEGRKLGVLCSRNTLRIEYLPDAEVYRGGWHSPKEKEILAGLLQKKRPVIACPVWGLDLASAVPGFLDVLRENRLLVLEMQNLAGDASAAEERNLFVLQHADRLFVPYTPPAVCWSACWRHRHHAQHVL